MTKEPTEVGHVVYRAARSTYAVFGAMWGVVVLAAAAIAAKNPGDPSAWLLAAILLAVGLFLAIWIGAYRLEFGRDAVIYRSLFGGNNVIVLTNVRSAGSPSEARRFTEPFLPPYRVEIAMKPGNRPARVIINEKVFTRDAVAHLRQFLSPWWGASSAS